MLSNDAISILVLTSKVIISVLTSYNLLFLFYIFYIQQQEICSLKFCPQSLVRSSFSQQN